jgi:hypothetical protein
MGVSISLYYFWRAASTPFSASVGMLAPFIVIPIVSAFTRAPSAALIDKAFANIG